MVEMLAACRLCQHIRSLQNSHLFPKALYRCFKKTARTDPVRVTRVHYGPTSKQVTARLLCSECEKRFNDGGEQWVLRNGYRGHGHFRLRDTLRRIEPLCQTRYGLVFSCADLSQINASKLIYFASSVFWRAAVHHWGDYQHGIELGKRYECEFRNYLLGHSEFPSNAVLTVHVADSEEPFQMFGLTSGTRVEGVFQYGLFAQGVLYILLIGARVRPELRRVCLVRSPERLIFLTDKVDQVAQSGAVSLLAPLLAPEQLRDHL